MKTYNDRLTKLETEHLGTGCISCIAFTKKDGGQYGTLNVNGQRYDFVKAGDKVTFPGLTGDLLRYVRKIYHQPRATYGINPPAKTNESNL